ncbi:triose-phosphate isomerase [Isachenkonia alkalipeptolytica]|uniref:Triosephosphate isomerase n=1 Tax=Isachenkonia alkalipeptolytica TaxID=2565777 RepID=A0AA43XMU4_9CLOT|nr:triose-phosphate isomerase [Isachenkonia alkalipeptolytica]NBG89194.1 triose-phosphate isomerase [Isachenkonia alkalipeptolytica]
MRIPIIAGNWKMNKNKKDTKKFIEDFEALIGDTEVEVVICPPFTSLDSASQMLKNSSVKLGAQNMSWEDHGAFTGEVSPEMLLEQQVEFVIIGHSERRQIFSETDDRINKKVLKALEKELRPILCVGETLEEREGEKAFEVVKNQLVQGLKNISGEDASKVVVAYEPVWAIGTGKTATPEDANEMAAFIRNTIKELYTEEISEEMIIQYGGSVKPGNVEEIMNQTDIDGALVGGASLEAKDFIEIVNF